MNHETSYDPACASLILELWRAYFVRDLFRNDEGGCLWRSAVRHTHEAMVGDR